MKIKLNKIRDLTIHKLSSFSDIRGNFSVNFDGFISQNLTEKDFNFVQSNMVITNEPLTFRGMHLQESPNGQNKVLYCVNGVIIDIVVDLRVGSSTYLEEEYILLDSSNPCVVYIPSGCAHGYISLTKDVIVNYYVDNKYCPESERIFHYDNLEISNYIQLDRLLLSEKDSNGIQSWIGVIL